MEYVPEIEVKFDRFGEMVPSLSVGVRFIRGSMVSSLIFWGLGLFTVAVVSLSSQSERPTLLSKVKDYADINRDGLVEASEWGEVFSTIGKTYNLLGQENPEYGLTNSDLRNYLEKTGTI